MRLEFLSQDDPVYLLPFFEKFVRSYGGEFEILQVGLCRTMGKRKHAKLARELLALYGVRGFATLSLRTLEARTLSWLPKRPNAKTYCSIAQLCRAYAIRCVPIKNPNSNEYIADLKRRLPDYLISVACPYILRQEVLSVLPQRCINIHHAPLPLYKGMMPTFWQLYNGERTVGLTIHYMVPGVDEGDALYQTRLEVHPGETLHALICRTKGHAVHCLAEVLRSLAAGEAKRLPLNRSKSSQFTFPTLQEIAEFHVRGYRAI